MYWLIISLYVLICLLLLLVVLLQQGKGGGIAAAFGGSTSQTAFGARSGATVLTRATAVLGTLFMLGAFVLSLMGPSGGSSVLSGVGNPLPAATEAPGPPPVAPPPVPPTPTGTPPAGGK